MNILEAHLARWKEKGHRMTKHRTALLELFLKEEHPLSAEEIQKKLKRRRLGTTLSTVYRELDFLEKENVIQSMKLQEDRRVFELSFKEHHHHLVCTNCANIQEMEMDKELEALERRIERKGKFTIKSHLLEFFGLCARCSA